MSDDSARQMLAVLREIRDGQRELLTAIVDQRALTEEQMRASRTAVAESVSLQRIAVARQRTITLIAVPGILACIAGIAYLLLRYF